MSALLKAERVRKHRGGRLVVNDLDLTVEAGERVVLRGANGSGKSTVLALLVGLLPPERGTITIGGARLDKDRQGALRGVGYAPDRTELPESLRVDEWLALVASLRGVKPLDRTVSGALRIGEIERSSVHALSLGQKRRVTIATAFVGQPPLLVLDEPTNGLDRDSLEAALRALEGHAESGGAILCATHDAAFAEALATRTVLIEQRASAP